MYGDTIFFNSALINYTYYMSSKNENIFYRENIQQYREKSKTDSYGTAYHKPLNPLIRFQLNLTCICKFSLI